MPKSMPKLKPIPFACAALCGLAAVLTLPQLLNWQPDTTHSVLMAALFVLLTAMGARLLLSRDGRLKGFSLAFGLALALCQLTGYRLDAAGTVGGGGLWLLLAALALSPAMGFCFAAFVRFCGGYTRQAGNGETVAAGDDDSGTMVAAAAVSRGSKAKAGKGGDTVAAAKAGNGGDTAAKAGNGEEAEKPLNPRRVFWLSFGGILLCWLPYYLAYFPGMFNFDAAAQTAQFQSGYYNTVYPLIHTLLLKGFYELGGALGSYNIGVALYTAVQAAAVAAAMAYAVAYVARQGCVKAMVVKLAVLFALLPFYPLLAMSTTKDLFFSAALLCLMLQLHAGWQQPERWRTLRGAAPTVLLTAAVCLLRTNGALAIAFGLAVGVMMLWKTGCWKRFAAVMLCGLVLFASVNTGLKAATHASGTGIREALSIPLMQVARVHALAAARGETLPEEAAVLEFIPDADRYVPHLSDGVKRHATVGVSNMPEFLRLWAALGLREPAVYWDAFLYLNKAYWYMDDQSHLDIYAERGDHGYMETKAHEGYGVTRESLWPSLEASLDRLFVANDYRQIPILSAMIEPGFWCWVLWAVMALALYRRRQSAVFCSAMLFGLFITMMLGPCAYIRYAYPLALCALPLLGLCLSEPDRLNTPMLNAVNKENP